MGVVVTIVDASDWVGRNAARTRIGELYMSSVTDMVANVLAFLSSYTRTPTPNSLIIHAMSQGRVPIPAPAAPGTTRMSKLNVLDHGSHHGLQIGTDRLNTTTFARFRPELARLAPKFETDGYAHLQHCWLGANIPLMEMFADTFGVPVVAGQNRTLPVLRLNLGSYTRVYPARGGSRQASETFFWGPPDQ